MQTKSKIKLIASATAFGIAITIRAAVRKRIEQQIYRQIHQKFSNVSIYGTWLRPEYQLLTDNYYLGGVNIINHQVITEYQFIANRAGKIIDIYKAAVHKVNPF